MTVSHKRDEVVKRGRNRKPRPKTFRTEQAAATYAKSRKIESYILKNLKSQESKVKKIVIIRK
jgi:23S rRNA maturation mini-RNase III